MKRGHRRAHGVLAPLLAAAVIGALLAAWTLRPDFDDLPAPERLGQAAAQAAQG